MIPDPPLHRGEARYEVRETTVHIAKGKNRPSRFAIAAAPARDPSLPSNPDATTIIGGERVGFDEYVVRYLAFWRADADPS